MASAYPGEQDPDDHKRGTREIIDAGVQVVVNTMEDEELTKRTPYQDIMRQHAKEGMSSFIAFLQSTLDSTDRKCKSDEHSIKLVLYHLANRELEFISFPIRDQSVHQDNQRVLDFCLELCDRIRRGQVILIHCW